MTFIGESNEVFEEQYDEFEEVYGCQHAGMEDLIRCCNCDWAECPMRGKKKN